MLEGIVGPFFTKIVEKVVYYVEDNVLNKTNFKSETLKRNFMSLKVKASDVEEEIKKAERWGKKKRKREIEDWLKYVDLVETEFLELENEERTRGFISRFLSRDRPAKINQRINELVEQSRHFGELLHKVYETRGEALLTAGMVGEAFEENLEIVMEFLDNEEVLSIGIYGMCGVGKTTLAKHIHNRLLRETGNCVIWVTVSQLFSIKKLQDKIAQAIDLKFKNGYDEVKRAAKLRKALSLRKGAVLILDDVWENIDLQKVGVPLSVEGCRLIITTRSLKVCHQIVCQRIIEVKTLHTDEAWDLFRETLGKETKLTYEVKGVAESMVKMCDGLPLGIVTLAGSMRGETAIHMWRNELEKLKKSVMGHDDMEDQVFKVLRYSFDKLNRNNEQRRKSKEYTAVQLCFLYCALYPEDYIISRDVLIRKLISEELVDRRKGRKAQFDEGHCILDKLVNVCLLESARIYTDGDSVKMHDLIRGMALKITEGKSMVVAGLHSLTEIPNEEEWTKDLEKVSLMCNRIAEIPLTMSPNCPKLTTLLFQDNPTMRVLPHPFFSRMNALCSLDLSRTDIAVLPNSLSDLESLKSLILGGCEKLSHIPNLGKLKALKELDLSNSGIWELPPGMENLVNLRYLSMNGANYLKMFPTNLLLNFQDLRYLLLPYQIETPAEEVRMLKKLEIFEGPVQSAHDFGYFIRTRQSRAPDTFYDVQVGSTYDRFKRRRNQVVLHPKHYQKAEEIYSMSAQDVLIFNQCVCLTSCLTDDFSQVEDPTSLKMLTVSNSKGIECLFTYEQFMTQESKFSNLEKILLRELPDFVSLIHKGAAVFSSSPRGVFSCLKYITICKCNKVKKLGLPALEFPNLEIICIQWCDELREIIETAGEGEREAPVIHLPKLRQLYLIHLPKLMSICNATMICNSIDTLHLEGCRALRKLPLYFPSTQKHTLRGESCDCSPPPTLKEIWIVEDEQEWWESMGWDHPTHYNLIQPFVHFWG